jgi:hypothetical protein
MAMHAVALQCLDRGVRCERARQKIAENVGDDAMSDPDEGRVFEVHVHADDFEGALARVWDAVAAAGADDHIVFAEHPDIPEHWKRPGQDGLPGALV